MAISAHAQEPDKTSEKNETVFLAGDVNKDGKFDTADVLSLNQLLAGRNVEIILENADANGNGKADTMDVLMLSQMLAGMTVEWGKPIPTEPSTTEEPTTAPTTPQETTTTTTAPLTTTAEQKTTETSHTLLTHPTTTTTTYANTTVSNWNELGPMVWPTQTNSDGTFVICLDKASEIYVTVRKSKFVIDNPKSLYNGTRLYQDVEYEDQFYYVDSKGYWQSYPGHVKFIYSLDD